MPKIIEFLGLPRTGKTTQIKLLTKHLENKGYKVAATNDRDVAGSIIIPSKNRLEYISTFISKTLEEYYKFEDKCDYFIFDRGGFDGKAWFEVEAIFNNITESQAKTFQMMCDNICEATHKVIFMTLDADEIQKRHSKTEHQKCDDIGLDDGYLKAITKAYEALSIDKPLLRIDENLSIEAIHEKIIGFV